MDRFVLVITSSRHFHLSPFQPSISLPALVPSFSVSGLMLTKELSSLCLWAGLSHSEGRLAMQIGSYGKWPFQCSFLLPQLCMGRCCFWASMQKTHGGSLQTAVPAGNFFLLKWRCYLWVQVDTCFSSIMPGIGVWLCGFGTQSLLPSAVTNKADLFGDKQQDIPK